MSMIEQRGVLKGSTVGSTVGISGSVLAKNSIAGAATISRGANDYESLLNIPSIQSVPLKGDKSFEDLGLVECSNIEIDNLFKQIF